MDVKMHSCELDFWTLGIVTNQTEARFDSIERSLNLFIQHLSQSNTNHQISHQHENQALQRPNLTQDGLQQQHATIAETRDHTQSQASAAPSSSSES